MVEYTHRIDRSQYKKETHQYISTSGVLLTSNVGYTVLGFTLWKMNAKPAAARDNVSADVNCVTS